MKKLSIIFLSLVAATAFAAAKVVKRGAQAWDARVSTSGRQKAMLAAQGGLMALRGALIDRRRIKPARAEMWSKI